MQRFVVLAVVGLIVAGVAAVLLVGRTPTATAPEVSVEELAAQAAVDVVLPDQLSARERQGRELFDAKCAACHGVNAAGSDNGPPLVHRVYQPGHHSDEAFLLATERGVRAHHWDFGDMPPREDVSRAEAAVIASYVCALQRANDIN